MTLPAPRGSLSERVFAALPTGRTAGLADAPPPQDANDAHVTLWALYELHYRGFAGVADELEWDPELIRVRRGLERDLEEDLRGRAPAFPDGEDFAAEFFAFVADYDGPSLDRKSVV